LIILLLLRLCLLKGGGFRARMNGVTWPTLDAARGRNNREKIFTMRHGFKPMVGLGSGKIAGATK
jgi:hypothetical protein